MTEDGYRLITVVPVNLGHWTSPDKTPRAKLPPGWNRLMFQEAAFNWSWLPPNCYGKLCLEMHMGHWRMEGKKIEIQLAWQKAVRDGGRRAKMGIIDGALVSDTVYKSWELYESDYFKLPDDWDQPILLWLIGRGEALDVVIPKHPKVKKANVGVAMWTLAIFEAVNDGKD